MAFRRLNPKLNFVFERLFGKNEHRECLIGLLNAILRQGEHDTPIVDLRILPNTRLPGHWINDKECILDIRAKCETGEQVNVEMQVTNEKNIVHRSLYYSTSYTLNLSSPVRIIRKLRRRSRLTC